MKEKGSKTLLYSSRPPCYQCASLIAQEGLEVIIPDSPIESFTNNFYQLLDFQYTQIKMPVPTSAPQLPTIFSYKISDLVELFEREIKSPRDSETLQKLMNQFYKDRLDLRNTPGNPFLPALLTFSSNSTTHTSS